MVRTVQHNELMVMHSTYYSKYAGSNPGSAVPMKKVRLATSYDLITKEFDDKCKT